ncbi:MAG: biosynthetic peptidoglycan transglycosylase, partial [Bacteroidota bacterium]
YFTPLSSIAPVFISSVMGSEDSHFFSHEGFNEDAFRKSIIENYKAGRFIRGGSTISMQLVKNVFLTRKKTLARKLEEALIVWMIESERLVTKERMLEVYLNIIELGPGIYGVGEASRYYFDKRPSDLELNESLFLATILPLPRAYRIHFDEHGAMKPFMAERFKAVSEKLLRKGMITTEQFEGLKAYVRFSPRLGIGNK